MGARASWCVVHKNVFCDEGDSFWKIRCCCGPSVISNTTPTPLCASLGCVRPSESSRRGLLPRRPAPLACHRSSLLFFSGFFLWSGHCSTQLPFTCARDSLLSHLLMSFTQWSATIARLVSCRFSLALHAGATHAFETVCWIRNSVFSFLSSDLVLQAFLAPIPLLPIFVWSFSCSHSEPDDCAALCLRSDTDMF